MPNASRAAVPQCFVAMAFGQVDTDAIYSGIAEVIESFGLKAKQMDVLQHDENINLRITEEIRQSDVLIADLTYARPSVYYEAGYAQRRIPVIYTVRSDHMPGYTGPQDWKVHFDVDRYKIEAWSNASDRDFLERLQQRLGHTLETSVRPSLIDGLREFRLDLEGSMLNPESAIQRIETLKARINQVPPTVEGDIERECENLRTRVRIMTRINNILEGLSGVEAQNRWREQERLLRDDAILLRHRYANGTYGQKVAYGTVLREWYEPYLECISNLYQRPSNEYGSCILEVLTEIEEIMEVLDFEQN